MTDLLEKAVARVRELAPEEQDQAAELLMSFAAQLEEPEELDEETRAAIEEGLAQAERGEFATDEEVAALFARLKE